MRKKSHISLARYMVENLKDEELKHHKFSFIWEVFCRISSLRFSIRDTRWTERFLMSADISGVCRREMR